MEDFPRKMSVAVDAWMDGSASEKLQIIRASELFDKTALIKHHVRGYARCERVQRGMTCLKTSVKERPSRPSVPLEGLRAIQLSELRVGECHKGRVLFGTLCVDAFKIVGILTVIEDPWGRTAKLQIYNAALSTSSFADAQRLYPKGAKVAIKEPYFKRAGDGLLMLRVDNPGSIELLDNPRPAPQPDSTSKSGPIEELRKCGNRCFGDEDWNGAIHYYSLCIEKGSAGEGASPSPSITEDQDILLGYSNRAESQLRLGNFEEALSDCNRALHIDPNHLKSLYRKGRALHALQQYEDAIGCFRSALKQFPRNNEIQSCLERSCEFNSQSQSGKYDVSAYLLSRRKEDIPEVADFVGPVVVKKTKDRRGRGLFVTRDVRAGDLLLVTNALAIADVDPAVRTLYMDVYNRVVKTEGEEDLVTKLVSLATSSRKALQQLHSLAESCSQEGMEVPSMELFMPNKAYSYCQSQGQPAEHAQVDVERIRNVVRLNSYERRFDVLDENQREETNRSSGLWILPSFINHSCLPNAGKLQIGRAMFVHASRNIRNGQEVTVEYFDTLKPLIFRSAECKKWEFTCSCRRCNLERSLQVSMDGITIKFVELHLDIDPWERLMEFRNCVLELEKFLRSAEHGLKAKEVDWIRASFFKAYDMAFRCADLSGSEIPTEAEYVNSLKRSVPGSPLLLLFTTMMVGKAHLRGEKQKAIEMAKEVCVAAVGNQKGRVLSAFIQEPVSVFHFV